MVDEEIGMPAKRELSMRQLRHLLRLHHDGVSAREIGRRLGVARSTIQDNLKRAAAAGLAWPLADDITDEALEQRLFGRAGVAPGQRRRVEPDWAALARELKRPGVTMMILWEEYREVHPEGYGYSRFCDLFRGFERRLSPVMRQHHVGRRQGVRRLLGQADRRSSIRRPGRSARRRSSSAVLGASNLTYAEATWTQTLPDWIGAHVRMFRFFGGVPRLVVPDNLKSGVHKASFYDPEINRTYGAMAAHYGVGILPARPRQAAGQGQGRGRGPIRPDLHSRPVAPSDVLLARRMQRGDRDRHGAHERASDAPPRREPARAVREPSSGRPQRLAGRRLRVRGMAAARGSTSTITSRSHDFLYSVPHALIRAEVDVRAHRAHRRGLPSRPARRRPSAPLSAAASTARTPITCPAPTGATPSGRRSGSAAGPARSGRTPKGLISAVLASRPHPEQGFRTCLGILRAFRGLDPARARGGLGPSRRIGASSPARASPPSSPASSTAPPARTGSPATLIDHANVRGPATSIDRRILMLAHPTLDLLHALGLHGLAKGFKDLEHNPEARSARSRRMARPAARTRSDAAPTEAVRNARQGRPAAPSGQRRGRQLSASPRARPRAVPQARRLRLDRRAPQSARSPGRAGWARVGSPARSATRRAGRTSRSSTTRVPRLFADLALARGDGRYARLLRRSPGSNC